jgi:hypothetical protein
MFFFVLVFIFTQSFFTYKGVQTIPFFNYGMFSEPAQNNRVSEKYIIKLDGKKLDIENSDNNIFPYMLYENLRIYKKLVDPNYNDVVLKAIDNRFKFKVSPETYNKLVSQIWNNQETIDKFPTWLTKFIAKRTKSSFKLLEFEVEYYTYSLERYNLIKTESILKYEY